MKNYIYYIHCKNYIINDSGIYYVELGKGIINFKTLIHEIREHFINLIFSLEVHEKELDKKYQPSIPVSENAPEEPGNDALWVDKKNLRLKLWDGENWQIVGYEPEDPKDPEKPVEPEGPDNTGQGGGESDGSKEETDSGNTDTGSTGDGSDNSETSPDLSGD